MAALAPAFTAGSLSAGSEAAEVAPSRLGKWFSFPVLGAGLIALIVSLWVPTGMADLDIWWHLRNAEVQLASHTFLTHDLFSFTAVGALWIDHEWLAELAFYLGWHLLGAHGVYLVTLGAIESIMLGVYYLAYRKSRSVAAATLTTLGATALASISFGPRTLLFGWMCLVIELVIFEKATAEERYVWALPGLFLLWVNVHGSWLIGMVLLLVFTLCAHLRPGRKELAAMDWPRSRLRALRLSVAASGAALFLNPYGWHLVAYPFDLAFRQKLNVANVVEWQTLDFHSPRGRILLAALAILFVMLVLRRRPWLLHELAFVAIAVYASFNYSRFLFLAAIVVMPMIARHLALPARQARTPDYPWINMVLLVSVAGVVVSRMTAEQNTYAAQGSYPYQATTYLQQFQPQGNVFNDYLWGGYLEWHVRQIPVFVDSRVDLFERNGCFRDYLDVTRLHNSFEILDKYKIRYVLFQEDAPLSYLLAHSSRWKLDYHDGRTALFERVQR